MKDSFFAPLGLFYKTNTFVPGRPTIVFIHGVTGSSSAWSPFEAQFRDSCNILSYDLRGHGKSVKYPHERDYAIARFADDLEALLAHCGIDHFVLVSHSFGSFVAFAYLARHPEKVSAAVFLSPIVSPFFNTSGKLLAPVLSVVNKIFDLFPVPRTTARHIDYSTEYLNSYDMDIPRMIAEFRNTGFRVVLYATRQSFSSDATTLLEKLSMPVLIVHGKKDTIAPIKNALMMQERMPNAELVVLPEADHIIVINHIPLVIDAIARFFAAQGITQG